ncbi:MAG: 50S ribosomal protein L18 [Deltaproteobacteria bacterium]|nr:50S ribosomal protein L18 [Deltaproteobacteria bacterium]
MERKLHNQKERTRAKRAASIRKRIEGTAERPRLSVFKSAKHVYAQLIDDIHGKTIVAASSREADIRDSLKGLKKVAKSEKIGAKLAEKAKAAGVTRVVFDRSGYVYHGRVAALAKGARDGGLEF